jgi:NCAIR mutase (PurE)-related protein
VSLTAEPSSVLRLIGLETALANVAVVDRETAAALLQAVAAGTTPPDEALAALESAVRPGVRDLGFARLDTARGLRTGDPEVVYAAGKTPDQLVALLDELRRTSPRRPALATRLTDAGLDAVRARWPEAVIDAEARCAVVGDPPEARGRVVVVSAGTSDGPVAAEAAVVARCFGAGVVTIRDAGVAGLHRLLAEGETLATADCIVAVAGMEGALPSVVGGLVGSPVVAVPTSVGYGASLGGLAALLAMLNSCAPGITVVNIDNGFGAGVFAARVARRATMP